MKSTTGLATLIALAVGTGLGRPAVAAPPDMEDVPLTLTGCVIAGEAKDSYMLTNVVIDGTTLAPAHAFYRFDTTKGLKEHVGRRVEVKGKADLDDVDKGKLKMKVDKDGRATTEITSERRTVKVNETVWFGSLGAMKLTADVPTYKFDVDSVKRLEGNCASAAAAR
jgi:hypothetical protein